MLLIGNNVKITMEQFISIIVLLEIILRLDSNSIISNSILGENVYIGRNSSIGQNGFGFYLKNDENINIYHIGRVILAIKCFNWFWLYN